MKQPAETEGDEFGKFDRMGAFRTRTLHDSCQPLVEFLHPGMSVLDVGCGEGQITVDVASVVQPGEVKGLDSVAANIARCASIATDAGVRNATFDVGDAYALPYQDGVFDLCYTNGLFDWLRDPLKALREQKRVTRSGGQVLAIVASLSDLFLYPDCPSVIKVLEGLAQNLTPAADTRYLDFRCGRHLHASFAAVGLTEIEVNPYFPADNVALRLSGTFGDRGKTIRAFFDSSIPDNWRDQLISTGLIRVEEFRSAESEMRVLKEHPFGLMFWYRVAIAGRVM